MPFAKLQVYPSGGVPVTRWKDEDDAFEDVAEGIAIAVEKLLEERQEQERLNLEKIQQERDTWEAGQFFNQGLEKQNKGDNQAAIADYNQAIKLKPDHAFAYTNRGVAHYYLGDYQAAIADYDQAIKLMPDLANAFHGRGNTRSALGDKLGAIADLQKAADLYRKQGNNEMLQKALNRIKELQQ